MNRHNLYYSTVDHKSNHPPPLTKNSQKHLNPQTPIFIPMPIFMPVSILESPLKRPKNSIPLSPPRNRTNSQTSIRSRRRRV